MLFIYDFSERVTKLFHFQTHHIFRMFLALKYMHLFEIVRQNHVDT